MKSTRRRSRTRAPVHQVVPQSTGIDRVVYDTPFDRFLHDRDIVLSHLAATSNHSRQHILKTRSKEVEPTAGMIRAYTAACIAITGDETISPLDLFDLQPDAGEIAAARRRYEAHQRIARRRITGS